jgi:hypothetical protein
MILTGTTGTAQALGPDGIDPTAVGALRLLIAAGRTPEPVPDIA